MFSLKNFPINHTVIAIIIQVFFGLKKLNEKILYKKIDHVINMKNKIWKKKIKDTVGKIIFYNPNNKVLKNTIKKII